MKVTRRKVFGALAVGSVVALLGWRRNKPDEFFPNLGLGVPQAVIVSHETPWWVLKAEEHRIVLQIPAAAWPALQAQFRAKRDFRDITPNLRAHYGEYTQGRQTFFPRHIVLVGASAGEFLAHGRDGYDYWCHYLRDDTTERIWFVGWSPDD